MAVDEDEDLERAFQLSLSRIPDVNHHREEASINAELNETSSERLKRIQREQRAAAAERRFKVQATSNIQNDRVKGSSIDKPITDNISSSEFEHSTMDRKLSFEEADELFKLVFGNDAQKEVRSQWSHQGFRFSNEAETSLGLVQSEGGPCGVLAPIQALIIKCLLFQNDSNAKNIQTSKLTPKQNRNLNLVFSKEQQDKALVLAMSEALWLAGKDHNCAVVVTVDINPSPSPSPSSSPSLPLPLPLHSQVEEEAKNGSNDLTEDERIERELESISLISAIDLQTRLHLHSCDSFQSLVSCVQTSIPTLRSRLGALLFLFSAVLSRTLKCVQLDRDDPEQSLVTQPFGHASQEIVNLLLCGEAVGNVFDDNMDMGGGMCLKGIKSTVEIGFLTLLESLNLCKVGKHLKNPNFPIWVIGSETHYTVLFALDRKVQDENEAEVREERLRRAFDELDSSGGGGFISPDAVRSLADRFGIELSEEYVRGVVTQGIVLWNEFEAMLLGLDQTKGGWKGLNLAGGKYFDLYHFNGIAKSVDGMLNQRPRLIRLQVHVPPRFDRGMNGQDLIMYDANSANVAADLSEGTGDSGEVGSGTGSVIGSGTGLVDSLKQFVARHAPLVECIRTRWKDASCSWTGDPPSIV